MDVRQLDHRAEFLIGGAGMHCERLRDRRTANLPGIGRHDYCTKEQAGISDETKDVLYRACALSRM